MAQHWMFLTTIGFLVAGIVFLGLWLAYGRLLRSKRHGGSFWSRNKDQYELVERHQV